MSASFDELSRAVGEFRRLVETIGAGGVSCAAELIVLDRLVRRYPAAARRSLELCVSQSMARRSSYP